MIGRDDLWRSDQQINQQGKKPMMKALSISKSRYVKKFLVQQKQKSIVPFCPIKKWDLATPSQLCMYFSKIKTQWVRN